MCFFIYINGSLIIRINWSFCVDERMEGMGDRNTHNWVSIYTWYALSPFYWPLLVDFHPKVNSFLVLEDPERFRLARDTTFGQRHLSVWSRSTILVWMVRIWVLDYIPNKPLLNSYLFFLSFIAGGIHETVVNVGSKGWLYDPSPWIYHGN